LIHSWNFQTELFQVAQFCVKFLVDEVNTSITNLEIFFYYLAIVSPFYSFDLCQIKSMILFYSMKNPIFHKVNPLEFIFQNLFFQPLIPATKTVDTTNFESLLEYISLLKERKSLRIQLIIESNSVVSADFITTIMAFNSIIYQLEPNTNLCNFSS
jgi:hypothetical protein